MENHWRRSNLRDIYIKICMSVNPTLLTDLSEILGPLKYGQSLNCAIHKNPYLKELEIASSAMINGHGEFHE